jgi:hypothetical protein
VAAGTQPERKKKGKAVRKVSYPQVRVLPDLTVPVRTITWTWAVGRITVTIAHARKPEIPAAFRDAR